MISGVPSRIGGVCTVIVLALHISSLVIVSVSFSSFFTDTRALFLGVCLLDMHALAICPNLEQLVHLVSLGNLQSAAECPSFAHLKHFPCMSLGIRLFWPGFLCCLTAFAAPKE